MNGTMEHALHDHLELEAWGPVGCDHRKEHPEDHVADVVREHFRTDEAVARVARALARLEPGEDWPTALEGLKSLLDTTDDEYRRQCREQAREAIDALLGES